MRGSAEMQQKKIKRFRKFASNELRDRVSSTSRFRTVGSFMKSVLGRFGLVLCAGVMSTTAVAQDLYSSEPTRQRQYEIDLGIGALVKPRYASADSYLVSPFPLISVGRFYLPGLGQVVDGRRKSGVFFYPSFGFVGERSAKDNADLTGTNTVDWAFELGLGGGYRTQNFRVFGELRQGFNGHSGQVGQFGVDGIIYPTDRIELSVGPRVSFASDDYMETYFGVTPAEAAASGGKLSAYNPGAGFKSVGLDARVSYDWTEKTRVHMLAGYDRLVGDAADSPIARQGSKNEFRLGLGVTYKFSFDLFN